MAAITHRRGLFHSRAGEEPVRATGKKGSLAAKGWAGLNLTLEAGGWWRTASTFGLNTGSPGLR
ncbi:hypothetical protein E2C01_092477 [Portunus trituberculatus]|uniref:Uncharacterized protein n=1 Tax=Portunus trituberculatus TaxID=210409 RepID=A0A5B7JVJ9_PORTR|nr:hypothetical protein [Portunus trituberculatus]